MRLLLKILSLPLLVVTGILYIFSNFLSLRPEPSLAFYRESSF